MPTFSAIDLFGPPPGGIADYNGAGSVTYVAQQDWVRDTTTGRLFKCIVSHTPAPGDKPPSKDPIRWEGEDTSDIGTTRIQAHAVDDGGWLVMSPTRVLMRSEHPRLLDRIAPLRSMAITSGSSTLRLGGSATQGVTPGEVVEMTGIPAGTMIGSVSVGDTKVGTVDSGTGPGSTSRIFFRPNVLVTGYQIAPPVEVTGVGIGANTTITSVVAGVTATMTSTTGSPNMFGDPTVTQLNVAVPGGFVTGSGFTAAARIMKGEGVIATTANNRSVTGSNLSYMSADLYSQIDESLLIGRQYTMTGFTGVQTIAAITNPEETIGGTWNWVTGLGFFAQWDIAPAESAKVIVNRKMSGGPITDVGSQHVTAVNAAFSRNGAATLGSASYFWQTGQAAVTQTVERRVGNAAGSLPANTYVTAHSNDVAATLDGANGSNTLAFGIGAAAQGVVGQFVTHAGSGTSQARVLAVQAEFTSANSSTATGSNQLFVQPGVPVAQMRVGQRLSGTNIPANTSMAAIGSDFAIASMATTTASTGLNLPVGTATAPYVTNRKITGTGIAANTSVAGLIAQLTPTPVQYLRNGSNLLRMTPAPFGVPVATAPGRYITDSGNVLPANTRVSSIIADFTVATVRAVAGSANLFWPVGGSIANVGADSTFTLPLAWPVTPARLTAAPVAQFTVANSSTTNAVPTVYLPVGQVTTSMSVGQQVTATFGVAAGVSITAINPEITVPTLHTLNTTASLFAPVGASVAGFIAGRKITGTGIPANTSLATIGVEATVPTVGTLTASPRLFFQTNAATAVFTVGRFVDVPGGLSLAQIDVTPVAQTTQVTTTTRTGQPEIYWPGGVALPATAIAGAYITAGGISDPARIVSTQPNFVRTGRTITGSNNVYLQIGQFQSGQTDRVGRGLSGTGIPANTRIILQQPEIALASITTANASTAITSPGLFVATMAGAYITGPGIPANAFIASVTNANAAVLSVAAGAGAGAGAATLGGWVTSSANSTSTNNNIGIVFTGYAVTDTNATLGSQATATVGAHAITTGSATATIAAGVTTTLGRVHTMSANATVTGNALATLGGTITLSANATATSNANTVTFAPWAPVDSLPAAAQPAGALATFGGIVTLSAAATADSIAGTVTFGPQVTLSANATATGVQANGILGAMHTMSANATGAGAAITVTYGRWVDIDATATANSLATAGTFGAISTTSAAATANDNTPLTFGSYVPVNTMTAGTQRNVSNLRGGAVLQVGTNAASTQTAVAATMGPAFGLSENASASGTGTFLFGGYANHDGTNTTQTIDTTLSFGSVVTMARAVIPSCTYSNVSGDVRTGATPTIIRCPDTSMLVVGQPITGPNIPGGATVASITNATQFVISAGVTGDQAGVTLIQPVNATASNETGSGRVFPYGNGDGSTTFGIGIDAAGRALVIGGTGSGLEIRPIGGKWGAERHTLTTDQMPAHNHAQTTSSAVIPLGSYGFIRRSAGASDTATASDASAGEPDIFNSPIAPWDNGSNNPMPIVPPSVGVGKAVAIYAGAM